MADLKILRQIEQQTGQTFVQLEAEDFKKKDGEQFKKQYAYALSPQDKIICLSLGTLYNQEILEIPFDQFQDLSILYLFQIEVDNFNFLSGHSNLDQLTIKGSYYSDFQALKNIKSLSSLVLRNNNITDVSFLKELKGLSSLDLRNNNITDVSFLKELKRLSFLDLSSNNITDFSFLKELKSLSSLDLSFNNITDFSFLKELKSLSSLDLSFNKKIDVSFLKELKDLSSLNLRNNNITDFSFLKELKSLSSLNLRNNNITDILFLKELKSLSSLDLSNNKKIDVSLLKELKGLSSLNLSNNNMPDVSFLKELKGLSSLDLSNNNITNVSFLKELKGLSSLNLSNNNITDFSFLKELKGLSSLDLSSNHITDFSFLKELKDLSSLGLSNNNITDVSFLKELKGLSSLNLSFNNITDVSFLKELKGLSSLSLNSNNIVNFSFLKELKGLFSLDLSNNNITDVSFLKELKGLSSLTLSNNNITDVSFLKELKGLSSLDLSSNNIKEIPRWLANFFIEIQIDSVLGFNCINLYDNPLQEPPPELAKQGNAAICNYFAQLDAQGKDYLYEAKMLIVGEGESGKTTLSHKIKDSNCALPHIDDRTKGITIQPHKFLTTDKLNQTQRQFQLNIWDFGGQEIYHYTHRFFLSKRSLYILVADNRKDDTDFNYWLNTIELFAGNSPMMIVLNEKGEIQRTVNQSELRGRFPDSLKDVCSVNFKTKEEADPNKRTQRLRGIETLIQHIEFQASHLPHIGEPIPARWIDVRQSIEADPRNHIDLEKFEELCQAQNITEFQDIAVLLSYFHDLGILLHFDSNPLLRNRVILKPTWATQAVYRIFDDDGIKEKQGRFTRQDCFQIWSDPQYRNMQDVLIELMKNFQLIYEIATTGNLVAPQMLPPNAPNYPWVNEHNSRMQFRYDLFMPKGIFWIFVVNMYRYIVNHDWVWRNGVILEREGTRAEIIENLFERRIYLRFVGPRTTELRAIITDELDQISKTFHKLKYEKMIPCNCKDCIDSLDPYFYEYSRLKKRLDNGKNTVECDNSFDNVQISLLLLGLDRPPAYDPPIQHPAEIPIQQKMVNKKIKIFLASSSELEADRREFEIFISRKNAEFYDQGIYLELNLWEDFLDAMSSTRLQDEYNKVVKTCDIVVSLFHTKVGKYTEEEFQNAYKTFKEDGKPLIFTYFKNAAINTGDITDSILSLLAFKKMLKDLEHFHTNYQDINDLKFQFSNQLTKLLPRFTQPND
jgi:internalin A